MAPDASAATERSLLGRFYFAETLREIFNLIFPFQFIYLFLAVEKPEWAVLPLVAGAITVLLTEIPTGVIADRFGRKRSVLLGFALSAVAWALVPLATKLTGSTQLVALCGCFSLAGLSQTLYSGAEEAWVVDNLTSANRRDLVGTYFAKVRSFASVGGVIANGLALAYLFTSQISRTTLDILWLAGAAGFMISLLIVATVGESRPEVAEPARDPEVESAWARRLKLLSARRGLLPLVGAIAIATFAGAAPDAAFDITLITRGMDARLLAPLGIADDVIGIIGPLVGIYLMKRFGAGKVLATTIALPALVVLAFLAEPTIPFVLVIWALLDFMDDIWDPVAETRMHELIPSQHRATLGSIVNQVVGVAELAGLGAFALLLGEHSEELMAARPDLIEAFTTGVSTVEQVPRGLFGLPLPDLAIVAFVIAGVVSVPFILKSSAASIAEDPV